MDAQNEPKVRIDCKQGLLRAVRFNADGQYALTCGSDRTIKLWRPTKLLQLNCYKGHSADVIDCQANGDSSRFLSCSADKSVILWDVETGKILRRLRNLAPFNTICFGGPEFSTAVAGSADGTVRIYDLRAFNAWEPIQTLTDATDSITCCRTFRHLIFSTSLDKGFRAYDLRRGSLSIDTLHRPLNHISINQDGSVVLLSTVRGAPVLLDRVEGKIVNQFEGNENKLFKIESTFMMDDSFIASGSEDGKVYLWNVADRNPKGILVHSNVSPPIIQSISSDTLDYLLTTCANFMFLWSLD